MKVIFNQTLIESDKAMLSMQSEAAMFGFGVFETLKIKKGTIAFFAEHFARLNEACQRLHLDANMSQASCYDGAQQLIATNQQYDGVLKINVFKNRDKIDTLVTTAPPRYSEDTFKMGFRLGLAKHRLHSRGPLVGLKHNNYMANLIALQEARAAGYDEALCLNENDWIVEGCASNLFFVKNKKLFTPCTATGLLNGIYRQHIIHVVQQLKLPIETGCYSLEALESAEEIFLTNSLLEIMPVTRYLERPLSIDDGEITRLLMEKC